MHEPLIKTTRNHYLDTVFFGSLFHASKNKIIKSIGEDPENVCFMRSLAKPLQCSIVFDSDIINKFNITSKELAIFSGSHTGTNLHTNVLKKVLKKNNLKVKDLSIEPLEPLDKRDFRGKKTKLHNNCSGKHTMMLLNCKYFGFNYDYTNPKHPLQKIIKNKQEELSEYKSEILTYDGCSTPLWGLPYKNVIKAYYNLMRKYPLLIKAILKNPYLYGGYNRLDSEIIAVSKGKLFSKVGAGGLVLIFNTQSCETVLIKMAQDNNKTRRLLALEYLNRIGWLKYETDTNIYNQKKQIVAKYEFLL